jgi:linoleoyl-CoA desaturase
MQHEPPIRALDDDNVIAFGRAIDALRVEVEAQLGDEDRAHIERTLRVSRRLELAGRGLLQFCIGPLGFAAGVAALGVHKCLELMEIGHMALHGAYERFSPDEALRSDRFVWRAPIDEASWRREHNVNHHQYTNIVGRDPDLDFGQMRLSPRVAFRPLQRLQPYTNVLTWLSFANILNVHVTGVLSSNDRSVKSDKRGSAKRIFLSKAARYYARELVLYPALAGPFFWKVALGNLLSDLVRDLCAGAIIYCGHVGAIDYPTGTKAGSRARWYAMQVESASNVELARPLSILCGALDKQIEHHLFPRLPPNRLREMAPRVRAICERHGIKYQSAGLFASLRAALNELSRMARVSPLEAQTA